MKKIIFLIIIILIFFCTYSIACDTPYLVTSVNETVDAYEIIGLGSGAILEFPVNNRLHYSLENLDPGEYTITIRQFNFSLGWSLPSQFTFTRQAPMEQPQGIAVIEE